MEEQLISFEVAKLAKEKGFTHQTGTLHPNGSYYNFRGELNGCCLESLREMHIPKKDRMYSILPAPTQSLLQKWLREGHELIITINFETIDDSEKAYTYTIYEWLPEGKNSCKDIWDFYETHESMTQSSGWFPTYEEALEEALKESLKLIK